MLTNVDKMPNNEDKVRNNYAWEVSVLLLRPIQGYSCGIYAARCRHFTHPTRRYTSHFYYLQRHRGRDEVRQIHLKMTSRKNDDEENCVCRSSVTFVIPQMIQLSCVMRAPQSPPDGRHCVHVLRKASYAASTVPKADNCSCGEQKKFATLLRVCILFIFVMCLRRRRL